MMDGWIGWMDECLHAAETGTFYVVCIYEKKLRNGRSVRFDETTGTNDDDALLIAKGLDGGVSS